MQNDIVRQPPKTSGEVAIRPVQPPQQRTAVPQTVQDVIPASDDSGVRSQPGIAPTAEQAEPAGTNSERQATPARVRNKSAKPIGIILAAVVVCGGLVGTAIYAGVQSTDSGNDKNATNQPAVATTDDTVKEAEGAIGDTDNLQNSEDLSAELSDATLGL